MTPNGGSDVFLDTQQCLLHDAACMNKIHHGPMNSYGAQSGRARKTNAIQCPAMRDTNGLRAKQMIISQSKGRVCMSCQPLAPGIARCPASKTVIIMIAFRAFIPESLPEWPYRQALNCLKLSTQYILHPPL